MTMRDIRTAVLVLSLLVAGGAAAQKETPPLPGTPRNFPALRIARFELTNGLDVRLVPYGQVPKVTIRLVVQTGNIDEGPGEVWLADLTSDLMQQGTATRAPEEIAEAMAMMGGALDVTVGANQTTLATDVFSEAAPEAIALLADVARNPRFPESELARLVADRTRQLSIARSSPSTLAGEKFVGALFPDSPYGRVLPTPEMLQSYSVAQIRGFHERNFGAARSCLYVAGQFDAAAVEQAVRSALGDWSRGPAPTRPDVVPVRRRVVYFLPRPGAVQSTLDIGLPVIDPSHADYLALTLTNALLGGSFASRITSNIREQKGYTYSPNSRVISQPGGSYWVQTADVTTKDTGASIREILREIDRLRREPPGDAELKGIQNYLAGTFVLRNSTRSGIASQLAFLDLYELGEEYLRTYVQRVYALTPADVQRIARTYIDPEKLAFVVVGDKAAVLDQIRAFGEVR
jgi:predicted Zn-dependent peptidase